MSVNQYGMPTGVQIPPATDFRQNQTASSRYRFRKILGEGSQAQAPFAGQLSATTDVNFRFGAGYVINLAKTRLRITELQRELLATGAIFTRALPPVRSIRLQTSSGVILFDIPNMDAYMNCVYPHTERFSERHKMAVMQTPNWASNICGGLTWSGLNSVGSTVPGSYPGGSNLTLPVCGPCVGTGLTSASATANGIAENAAIMEPGGPYIVPGLQACSVVGASADSCTAGTPVDLALGNGYAQTMQLVGPSFAPAALPGKDMPRQYIPTINYATAPTTAVANAFVGSSNYFQWDVPLANLLPHTMAAALQDLYFGTDLLLTVTFDSMQNRTFKGVVTTAAYKLAHPDNVPANGGLDSSAVNPGSTEASCYYATDLLLATQDNLDLVNSVKQEIAGKGIRIPVQQPFVSIESISRSTTDLPYSRVIRLNIARGAALLKYYAGIMESFGVSGSAYANRLMNNLPATGVSVALATAPTLVSVYQYPQWKLYRAFLNAVPMSDSAMDPRDVWKRQSAWVNDCFSQTFKSWLQMGGAAVEDFTSGFDLRLTTPEGGLPLANPIDVQIDTTVSGVLTSPAYYPALASITKTEHIWVGVMLKYLSISPAGVTLESV